MGTATATLTSLREQGWQILAAEHSYVAGNPYKGLHTLVRKGSITAELQFHTEASQALKDRAHVDYETARDATVPIPQRRGRGPGHAPGLGTASGPARPGRPDRALRHRPDHQDLPIGGATMFYLARARNEPRSQPYVIWQQNEDAHLYVFVPNTGQFHRNDALTTDFYFDQDVNDYEPIAPERAAREVANGTGRIDERKNGWIVQEYRTDPAPIAPATILPDKDGGAPAIRSTPSQHARRIGRLLTNAEPHVWLTYRTYDPDQRQQAHTCAYDIRHGKIKALADLDLQTRIVPTSSGTLEVQVSRHPDRSQGHTAAAAAN